MIESYCIENVLEVSESPFFWRDVNTSGFIWTTPLDACNPGFAEVPQELLDEGESECFLCQLGEFSIIHKTDLYAQGLTRKIMEFLPPIHISEW